MKMVSGSFSRIVLIPVKWRDEIVSMEKVPGISPESMPWLVQEPICYGDRQGRRPHFSQDAEKVRQRRCRFAQRLPVPNKVRVASSLAAALLDGFLSILRGVFSSCPAVQAIEVLL